PGRHMQCFIHYDVRRAGKVSYSWERRAIWRRGKARKLAMERSGRGELRFCVLTSVYRVDWRQLTPLAGHSRVKVRVMGVSKLQIGQLWKKDGTKDIYLVTTLFSEALNNVVILRKSGSEGEAQVR